jgi:hypothetical protein
MQLKPRFEKFKIKERHKLLKDDSGATFYLTKVEAFIPSDKNEVTTTPYEYWCVINDKQDNWSNKKVVSYGSEAFWKANERTNLLDTEIKGLRIKEVFSGSHYYFSTKKMPSDEDKGVRTTFEIIEIN